jgi:Adenylate and Guanylate cyclase catalytic domain
LFIGAIERLSVLPPIPMPSSRHCSRLLEENQEMHDASTKPQKSGQFLRFQLGEEANDDDGDESKPLVAYSSKPIADLFTETTILFADIAGFSAWSSVREPSQVFVLLETLFRAFDEIAKKRRVFKVRFAACQLFLCIASISQCGTVSDRLIALGRNRRRLLRCCCWPTRSSQGARGSHGAICLRMYGLYANAV